MKLYNTLTRTVEEVKPLAPPVVTVYTCGPTVYDYTHIGHWFTYVRADLLIRTLRNAGLRPKWVMNITDVGHLVSDADEGEDKLEKGARREGKTAWEVAEFYTQDFLNGMKQLGMTQPDHIVKATDHIAEQIELIKKLEDKGYTYRIDDGIYYDTSKFEGYAAFARLDLDEQQNNGRVASNPQKRQPSDFALWKFSPKDRKRDMEWDSPWGKGFPGWHVECSAMSMKYLGETLDIHTGGIDHIPVHHTNEIAQSEAATGKRFAIMWMHTNHILVNGEKIAKSLRNGVRLQDITAEGISTQAIRLHVLESHYRSQSHFSMDGLKAAENRLKSLRAMADLRFQVRDDADQLTSYEDYSQAVLEALQQDLDTPKALASLSGIFEDQNEVVSAQTAREFTHLLEVLDQVFGLGLLDSVDITDEQKSVLAERQKVRDAKDWTRSDQFRDQLKQNGIAVRDTAHGQIWHRL